MRRENYRGLLVVVVESGLIPEVWAYQVWKSDDMIRYKAGYGDPQRAMKDGKAAVDDLLAA